MTALVLVLLGLALVGALLGWVAPRDGGRPPGLLLYAAGAAALLLAATAAVVALSDPVVLADLPRLLVLALAAGLAVAGGPVVVLVFVAVDRRPSPETAGDGAADPSVAGASAVLRGGAWIGALERAAIFATLVAGWPDGLLAVVGLKGLGRYPELRSHDNPAVAERFIIGTFASVLWAVACAGLARALV